MPLASLATFTPGETRGELLRENQQQMIVMTADLSGRSLGAVMGDVQSGPRRTIRRRRASASSSAGSTRASSQAFRALLLVLGLAAASVIAVMVLQFQSFVEPLVILLAAPLSFVGALRAAAAHRARRSTCRRSWG